MAATLELPATQDDTAARDQRSRVASLIGQANAAVSSGNQLDLLAAQQALGTEFSSSEAAVLLSFVNGALTQVQATQLLQAAQTQPDPAALVRNAVDSGIIAQVNADAVVKNVPTQDAAAAQTATVSANTANTNSTTTVNAGASADTKVTVTTNDGAATVTANTSEQRVSAINPEKIAASRETVIAK